jgi:hypothetical protein
MSHVKFIITLGVLLLLLSVLIVVIPANICFFGQCVFLEALHTAKKIVYFSGLLVFFYGYIIIFLLAIVSFVRFINQNMLYAELFKAILRYDFDTALSVIRVLTGFAV